MASITEISNMALTELGAEPISDIAEGRRNSKICEVRYPDIRDAVLRAHPWSCAKRLFELASSGAPAYGFAFQYLMPTDPYCLRVLGLAEPRTPWKPMGRLILTDAPAPLRGTYVARIGEEDMDALLVQAIAMRLGAAIAYRLTNSQTQVERMFKLYELALREARSINAQEGLDEEDESSDFLAARL